MSNFQLFPYVLLSAHCASEERHHEAFLLGLGEREQMPEFYLVYDKLLLRHIVYDEPCMLAQTRITRLDLKSSMQMLVDAPSGSTMPNTWPSFVSMPATNLRSQLLNARSRLVERIPTA